MRIPCGAGLRDRVRRDHWRVARWYPDYPLATDGERSQRLVSRHRALKQTIMIPVDRNASMAKTRGCDVIAGSLDEARDARVPEEPGRPVFGHARRRTVRMPIAIIPSDVPTHADPRTRLPAPTPRRDAATERNRPEPLQLVDLGIVREVAREHDRINGPTRYRPAIDPVHRLDHGDRHLNRQDLLRTISADIAKRGPIRGVGVAVAIEVLQPGRRLCVAQVDVGDMPQAGKRLPGWKSSLVLLTRPLHEVLPPRLPVRTSHARGGGCESRHLLFAHRFGPALSELTAITVT